MQKLHENTLCGGEAAATAGGEGGGFAGGSPSEDEE
uniref:Uncharacterized protein n=1 Tax=Arundo donax TaxID=35708 RepID=A0A0A8Y3J4_ARUDO